MRIGYLGAAPRPRRSMTILLIVVINFMLFRAMPGSPERIILRGTPNVTQEMKQAARERWGLDKPVFPDQFVAYVAATVRGDLGFSFVARGQTVTEVIGQRIWPTIILFGLGELIAIVVGLALGAYTGWRRGGPIDYVGNGDLADPVLDAVLPARDDPARLIFATGSAGSRPFGMFTAGRPVRQHLRPRSPTSARTSSLPLATVALGLIGQYAIVMRSSIIETLSEDYVTTARGMGLKDGRDPAPPRPAERAAADGLADRDQPRATSSPARSRSRSCSTGPASGR